MSDPLPLRRRPFDLALVGFFALNLLVITYLFDIEQVVIPDPSVMTAYPAWPPEFMVRLAHWWERSFDPLLWARPPWYKATIWIDLVFFGPFYAAALWAFVKGREWIRAPALVWAGVMMTNVTIILSEEIWGPHASPKLWAVLAANASWLIFPLLVIARCSRSGPLFARRDEPQAPRAVA